MPREPWNKASINIRSCLIHDEQSIDCQHSRNLQCVPGMRFIWKSLNEASQGSWSSTNQILELLLPPETCWLNSWGPKQHKPTSSDSNTHNKKRFSWSYKNGSINSNLMWIYVDLQNVIERYFKSISDHRCPLSSKQIHFQYHTLFKHQTSWNQSQDSTNRFHPTGIFQQLSSYTKLPSNTLNLLSSFGLER